MASKSPVLPILIVGGLAVGGVLAYKAISNSDDTSGFVSGVTGSYIDEPSQRVILTDLRQGATTDRVIYRQDTARELVPEILSTGESVFNTYTDYKLADRTDKRDTKVEIKDIKIEGRNDRAENRQETRLTRQTNRQDAREDRKIIRIDNRNNRKKVISNAVSAFQNRKRLFNRR